MIRIEKLADRHIEAIKSIQLAPEQVKFAGTAKEFLAEASDTTHLHVIRLDNDIVGFFKIDTDYESNYDFCPNTAIGLRTFVIDQSQQGKGIGTRAVRALVLYIAIHYSGYHSIYLTVNCKNPAAKVCYQKGGFQDSEVLYLGGAAGPQYVMFNHIR